MQEPPKNTNKRDTRVLGWVAFAFSAATGASLLAKSVLADNSFRGVGYHPLEAQAVLCGSAAAVIAAWVVLKSGVIECFARAVASAVLVYVQAILAVLVYTGRRLCWSRRRLVLHVIAASIITVVAHSRYATIADQKIRDQFARYGKRNECRVIHDGINGQMLISSTGSPGGFRQITIKPRADWEHDCKSWYGYHTFMQCLEDSTRRAHELGWTADRLQRQSDEIEREFTTLKKTTPVSLEQINNLMDELQSGGRKKVRRVRPVDPRLELIEVSWCRTPATPPMVPYIVSGRRITTLNYQNPTQVIVHDFEHNHRITATPGRLMWRAPAPILTSLVSFLASIFCIAFLFSAPAFYIRSLPPTKTDPVPLSAA